MVFTGRMLRRPATCISGYLAVVTVASIVYYARHPEVLRTQEMNQEAYTDRDYDNLIQYRLYFLWSSMFGIFAGLLTSWKEQIGLTLMGSWGGLCFALIINEFMLFRLGVQALFYILAIIAMLSGGIIA